MIFLIPNDYHEFSYEIATLTNVPVEKLHKIIKEVENDSETNGGVSFWQHEENAIRIAHYATLGGEWKGNIVKRMLKIAARLNKIRYENYTSLFISLTGSNTPAVIVLTEIPQNLVINQGDIGKNSELYTYEKVPAKYIKEIKIIK